MSATVFNTSLYKNFPFRKLLDNEAVYTIAANNIAGQYIQNRLSYWDKEDKHEWLHLGNRLSTNNDLCFIYQDNVFSVLLEINNEHRINNPSKNRFIEHCKKNNLIPCLFPVTPKLLLGTTKRIPGLYVDDRGIPEFTFEVGCYPAILQEWKENPKSMEYIDDYVVTDKSLKLTKLHKDYENISNWNLVNALTYEPIYPHKLAPNKQKKPSFYEFECRSFNFAERAILNGKLFKSMEMGYPQVMVKLPVEKEISEEQAKKLEEFNKNHVGVVATPITKEKYCAVLVKTFDSTEEFNQIRNTYKFPLEDIYDFRSLKESGVGIFCAIVYENYDKRENVTCRKIFSNINKLYTDDKYCYLEFDYKIS